MNLQQQIKALSCRKCAAPHVTLTSLARTQDTTTRYNQIWKLPSQISRATQHRQHVTIMSRL